MLVGCRQIFGVDSPTPVMDAPPVVVDVPRDGMTDGAPPSHLLCQPDEVGLVGCWDFDGSLADSSPNQLDITPVQVQYVAGHIGQAVVTNTVDLNVPDSHALDLDAVTIEAWIYVESYAMGGGRSAILDNSGQYAMYIEGNGTLRCYTGPATADNTDVVQLHVWTHVACAANGQKLHAYVNGVEVASGVGAGIPTTGTTGLTLGSDNPSGSGSRFAGRLDAVRLYGRMLTQAEIRCAYNPNC